MIRRGELALVLLCIAIGVSSPCIASEGRSVSVPSVDIEIGICDDDVSALAIDFTITNPNQKTVNLTGLEYYVEIYEEYTVGEHLEKGLEWVGLGLPIQSIRPLETNTITRKVPITAGIPLERFLREGFINFSIDGSLSTKIDNESFEVPFEKATTVYLEIDEKGAKRAICPNITGIELKTSKLESPDGEITDVFINQSIIITNPNPTTICLDTLDYTVYYKKDDKWVRLSSGFAGGDTIEAMGSYRQSMERRESDAEVIQFFLSGNPIEIKIRGSMFMYPKERGWSPTYFEPSFERVITTINGSGVWGEVTPIFTSTPMPSATPTSVPAAEAPEEPGFEAVFTLTVLLAVTCIVKRRG
jgi:LEA14-like dessication related protein